jgi:Glycosyl transferases group 1
VKDLEPLFNEARVSLAPLRFGSGIKVKVLNSMCRGLPIVTTSIGAEGIDARHMQELAITDSASDMAQAIDTLLTDRAAWQALEQGSRNKVREKYTWEKVLGAMREELVCNKRGGAPPLPRQHARHGVQHDVAIPHAKAFFPRGLGNPPHTPAWFAPDRRNHNQLAPASVVFHLWRSLQYQHHAAKRIHPYGQKAASDVNYWNAHSGGHRQLSA